MTTLITEALGLLVFVSVGYGMIAVAMTQGAL